MTAIYDITIIGGGPVGLFAAFYANLRKAKVKIIDSLPQLGGQPAVLYPEKTILDIAGFPQVSGEKLTQKLIEQLEPFETTICLNEKLEAFEKTDDLFTLTTDKGQHLSKTILIAMGGGAFKPRTLDLAGIDDFDNIHYHVENIKQYSNQNIVVLGGGDSAVDWSLAFDTMAAQTTIVHRREAFRALEHSVHDLQASTVQIKTPFIPSRLIGENGKLTALEITQVKGDTCLQIPLNHLFVNYGFKSSVGKLKDWGLELHRHKIIVNSKQATSIDGVFAAGDCCYYEGKVDLIATGFGEAPTAVNNAINYINPKEKIQPKHSTSLS